MLQHTLVLFMTTEIKLRDFFRDMYENFELFSLQSVTKSPVLLIALLKTSSLPQMRIDY
jgi:hypothetical protein